MIFVALDALSVELQNLFEVHLDNKTMTKHFDLQITNKFY
jgi:hypothetical protein